jgi:hypothetical protein
VNRAIAFAHILILLAGTFLLTALGWEAIRVGHRAEYTFLKVDAEIDNLHHLTSHIDEAVKNVNKAATDESTYFSVTIPQVTGHLQTTLTGVDKEMASLNDATVAMRDNENLLTAHTVTAVDSLNQTILQVQPVLQSSQAAVAKMTVVESDLDKQVNNPDIGKTLSSVQTASANVAVTTANVAATSGDVKQYVDSIIHPSWETKVWHVVLDVAHALNPF